MSDHVPEGGEASAVRSFNRFYTRQMGLMEESYLHSGLTLVESRVLFELAQGARRPQDIVRRLGMDPGYVSRLVRSLLRRNLITRKRNSADGRSWLLSLTAKGKASFAKIDKGADEAAANLLAPLPKSRVGPLVAAMKAIESAFMEQPLAIRLRGLAPGDIGHVTERQGLLYHQEYGWDTSYEALVAKILAEFQMKFDARKEACWIADSDQGMMGSVFLVRENDETARLRLLYVEPMARGTGLGRRLVRECTAFARDTGCKSIVLWTQSMLTAARKIYESENYVLVKSEPHRSFGQNLVGETWRIDL
jgi:DNA-binding MarR family transcriptional regulator/GNAT superfamily N-acetyltransferase